MKNYVESSSKDHSMNGELKETSAGTKTGYANAQRLDEMSRNEIERAVETQNKLMEEFSFDLKDYFGGPSVDDLDASCHDQRLRNLFNEVLFTENEIGKYQEAKKHLSKGNSGKSSAKADNSIKSSHPALSFKMAQQNWVGNYGSETMSGAEMGHEFRNEFEPVQMLVSKGSNLPMQPTSGSAFLLSKRNENESQRAVNPSHSPDTRQVPKERHSQKKQSQPQFPLSKSLSSQSRFLVGIPDPVNIHHSYLSTGSNKSENNEETDRVENDYASPNNRNMLRQPTFKSVATTLENVYSSVKASGVSSSVTSLSKGRFMKAPSERVPEDEDDFVKQFVDSETEKEEEEMNEDMFIAEFVGEALRNMPLSKITRVLVDLFRNHKEEFYYFQRDFLASQEASSNPMETRENTLGNAKRQFKPIQNRNMGVSIPGSEFGIQNSVPTPKNTNNCSSENLKRAGARTFAQKGIGSRGSEEFVNYQYEKTNPSKSPERTEFSSGKLMNLSQHVLGGQPSSRGGHPGSGVGMKGSYQNTSYGQSSKGTGKEKKVFKDFSKANNQTESKSSRKNPANANQKMIDRKLIERAHQAKKSSGSSSSFVFPSGNGGVMTPRSKERQEMSSKLNGTSQILSPKTSGQFHGMGMTQQGSLMQNTSGLIQQNGANGNQVYSCQGSNSLTGAQYYQAFQKRYMGTGAGTTNDGSKGMNSTQVMLARYKNPRKEVSTDKKYEILGGNLKNQV